MSSEREKFLFENTLISLLKALEGRVTVVELRNENIVTGQIDHVDGFMNVSMSDVVFETYRGKTSKFDSFFVQGVNIRYVHIPNEIDIRKAIEAQIGVRRQMRQKVSQDIQKAALEKMQKRRREYEKSQLQKERQKKGEGSENK